MLGNNYNFDYIIFKRNVIKHMNSSDFSLNESEKDMKKYVECFAEETIKEVENRSKLLNATMTQIANNIGTRG